MQRVTVKTSTIFIAKGGRTRVYRSVEEVPAPLRKELEESTNGFNSATILIADRRGRAEIIRALNGLPSTLRSRLATSLAPAQKGTPPGTTAGTTPGTSQASTPPKSTAAPVATSGVLRFLQRNWLEISLPVAVALIVWAAFNYRS
jgi:hypothetical protein